MEITYVLRNTPWFIANYVYKSHLNRVLKENYSLAHPGDGNYIHVSKLSMLLRYFGNYTLIKLCY